MKKKTTFTAKPTSPAATSLDAFVGVALAETPPPKMKRLTIDLPPSLHRRVKVGCAVRGIEIATLLRQWLEQEFPA